jgi:flagellar protein FlbD
MIPLTRLNHVPLVINSDLIEHIEVTPDTVVALTTGQKFLVLETAEEIVDRIVQFRRRLLCGTVVDARGAMRATPASGAHDADKQ